MVVIDGTCSNFLPVNAGESQSCVFYTLYRLSCTNRMGYRKHQITRWTYYIAAMQTSQAYVSECRNKLVSEIETLLNNVWNWSSRNHVQLNSKMVQISVFATKKNPFCRIYSLSQSKSLETIPTSHSRHSRHQYFKNKHLIWKIKLSWLPKSLVS